MKETDPSKLADADFPALEARTVADGDATDKEPPQEVKSPGIGKANWAEEVEAGQQGVA